MTTAAKSIVNLTRGTIVCERAVIADQPLQRMRGLLGRGSLPAGEGLLLKPAPSIHTAFMGFPIDVVFMDRDLRVLKLVEGMRPWRTASARRARLALELAAGEIRGREIEPDDLLDVADVSDLLANPTGVSRPGRSADSPALDIPIGSPARNGRSAATRVLLISADRRFRAVADALLTRRGCSVAVGERMANVAQLAKSEAADVVVLDAGNALTAAAFHAAQIALLSRPVGLVVVGEEPGDGLAALPMLPKWQGFDRLYNAVEEARVSVNGRRS